MFTDLDELYDKIYRYCYMKTRNPVTAEDITQETFLHFMETSGYQEIGKKLPYLYTIARNLCIDFYRQKEYVSLEDMDEERIPSQSSEDSIILRLSLQQAVMRLLPEEQELIFLRYVNELPMGQISDIMGISRFALYRKLNLCRKKLKTELRRTK